MDAIRLSLMCAADMTLLPVRWSENRGSPDPDFEAIHTCRDLDALRAWAVDRDAADENAWPKNAEKLHAKGY